jgi:hypothetical protein
MKSMSESSLRCAAATFLVQRLVRRCFKTLPPVLSQEINRQRTRAAKYQRHQAGDV